MFCFHFQKKIRKVAKNFHNNKKTVLTTSAYNQVFCGSFTFFSGGSLHL
jgi:hypothetical protein